MNRVVAQAAAVLFCAVIGSHPASAADIKILSPGATEGVLSELLPQFEKATGHKITINYGPVGSLADRVSKGEAADIVILSEPEAERLRHDGKTVDGSQVVVGKVGIGIFVRKGDPKPDISTPEAFVHALATAKLIAYGDPKRGGSASILVAELLKSLDTTGSIQSRTRLVPPAKPLVDLVAGGGIDFGFQPISQIYLDPRIEFAGALPAKYQHYSKYVASLVTTSRNQDVYKTLTAFVSSHEADAAWRKQGFEPR